MIVCLCKGVSSRTIIDEIHRGHRTLRQVRAACKAGTDCGACTRQIRQLIEKANPTERPSG
ncbi:MAG: (2Fe-2S)-binding protein [Myxococcales bacterium]|nr:(2Fe-2S)-binding protein [Myxococcales bacterium]MCB9750333.1 (2Fe-2S)-binding protein [Myxococcales bacterium]